MPRPPRGLVSLERKLPLLITLLLLLLIAAGVALAYREVRSSALEAARVRLETATFRIATSLAENVASGLASRRDTVSAPAVLQLLSGPPGDTTALPAAREALASMVDGVNERWVEVRDAEGVLRFTEGEQPAAFLPRAGEGPPLTAPVGDDPAYSAIFALGDSAYLWTVVPVEADGRRLGRVAQLRNVTGSATSAQLIEELIGPGTSIAYASPDGGVWVGADGAVLHGVGDTDVESAVEGARRARADAEAANRAKSEFLATMSHGIRTPINAILGYTDLLEAGVAGELSDEQRRQLVRIQASGRHLTASIEAVKFTPSGGEVRLSATTRDDGHGRWVELHVEDTGPGVPAEKAEVVFEPFVQAEGGLKRSHGGVGLGLAISRRLARMMDGEVALVASAGGAHFVLRLPLVPSAATVAAAPG